MSFWKESQASLQDHGTVQVLKQRQVSLQDHGTVQVLKEGLVKTFSSFILFMEVADQMELREANREGDLLGPDSRRLMKLLERFTPNEVRIMAAQRLAFWDISRCNAAQLYGKEMEKFLADQLVKGRHYLEKTDDMDKESLSPRDAKSERQRMRQCFSKVLKEDEFDYTTEYGSQLPATGRSGKPTVENVVEIARGYQEHYEFKDLSRQLYMEDTDMRSHGYPSFRGMEQTEEDKEQNARYLEKMLLEESKLREKVNVLKEAIVDALTQSGVDRGVALKLVESSVRSKDLERSLRNARESGAKEEAFIDIEENMKELFQGQRKLDHQMDFNTRHLKTLRQLDGDIDQRMEGRGDDASYPPAPGPSERISRQISDQGTVSVLKDGLVKTFSEALLYMEVADQMEWDEAGLEGDLLGSDSRRLMPVLKKKYSPMQVRIMAAQRVKFYDIGRYRAGQLYGEEMEDFLADQRDKGEKYLNGTDAMDKAANFPRDRHSERQAMRRSFRSVLNEEEFDYTMQYGHLAARPSCSKSAEDELEIASGYMWSYEFQDHSRQLYMENPDMQPHGYPSFRGMVQTEEDKERNARYIDKVLQPEKELREEVKRLEDVTVDSLTGWRIGQEKALEFAKSRFSSKDHLKKQFGPVLARVITEGTLIEENMHKLFQLRRQLDRQTDLNTRHLKPLRQLDGDIDQRMEGRGDDASCPPVPGPSDRQTDASCGQRRTGSGTSLAPRLNSPASGDPPASASNVVDSRPWYAQILGLVLRRPTRRE